MQGDLTVRNRTAEIDVDLGDTLELVFDALQFAFMGRAEAQKGPLLFTLDLLYLNLEDENTTSTSRRIPTLALDSEVSAELLITEFGGGYRLGTWPLGAAILPALSFDVLAGGRYVYFEGGIEVTGSGPLGRGIDVKRDTSWIEPFIGGRFSLRVSERVIINVRGDAGGFGIGSDLTWSVTGAVLYRVMQHGSLALGYRALDIDYSQGSGTGQRDLNLLLHGPLLGFVLQF
jgi:hypothetical protein